MRIYHYEMESKSRCDVVAEQLCRRGPSREAANSGRKVHHFITSAFSLSLHRVASGNRVRRTTCEGMAAEGITHLPQYASGFHDALGTVRSLREKARLGTGRHHWPRRTRCETMRGSVRAAQYVERVASFPFLGGTPSAHFTPTVKASQYKTTERKRQ